MGKFEKKPAGTQRTRCLHIRVRPEFSEPIQKKLDWLSKSWGRKATISELLRLALKKYCTDPDDPRDA